MAPIYCNSSFGFILSAHSEIKSWPINPSLSQPSLTTIAFGLIIRIRLGEPDWGQEPSVLGPALGCVPSLAPPKVLPGMGAGRLQMQPRSLCSDRSPRPPRFPRALTGTPPHTPHSVSTALQKSREINALLSKSFYSLLWVGRGGHLEARNKSHLLQIKKK